MESGNIAGYQIAHAQRNPSAAILREQRIRQKMTQVQVAAKAEITLQQYQKFENGSRNIKTASFQLACRVLRALNMSIDRFFDGDYALGEEIYAEDGKLKYKKTGRDIRDDVEESEEAE